MKVSAVYKRAVCLTLTLLTVLCLTACNRTPNDPTDTDGETFFPDTYTEGDYANNPRAVCATAVGENTIRVKFNTLVRLGDGKLSEQIRYRSASGSEVGAESYRTYGNVKDSSGYLYSTIIEFDFSVAVNDGTLIFVEKDGDGDRAMKNVCYSEGGTGMYATGEGKTELALGTEEIVLPEEQVMMIDAVFLNRERGIMQMTFSAPVRCLTKWESCVFVSDVSNPNPGVGDSWQYSIRKAVAVDGQKGDDGNIYAKTWQISISATEEQLKNFPEHGVVRVSENDSLAAEEFASDWDNYDLARVCVAIDGRPLQADDYIGWDVAFISYR